VESAKLPVICMTLIYITLIPDVTGSYAQELKGGLEKSYNYNPFSKKLYLTYVAWQTPVYGQTEKHSTVPMNL
jgi:hypothetical protein